MTGGETDCRRILAAQAQAVAAQSECAAYCARPGAKKGPAVASGAVSHVSELEMRSEPPWRGSLAGRYREPALPLAPNHRPPVGERRPHRDPPAYPVGRLGSAPPLRVGIIARPQIIALAEREAPLRKDDRLIGGGRRCLNGSDEQA